jgi:hypothetical protein
MSWSSASVSRGISTWLNAWLPIAILVVCAERGKRAVFTMRNSLAEEQSQLDWVDRVVAKYSSIRTGHVRRTRFGYAPGPRDCRRPSRD